MICRTYSKMNETEVWIEIRMWFKKTRWVNTKCCVIPFVYNKAPHVCIETRPSLLLLFWICSNSPVSASQALDYRCVPSHLAGDKLLAIDISKSLEFPSNALNKQRYYYLTCMGALPVCLCTTCMLSAVEARRRCSIPWELKLQVVINHHMGAGNQTCMLGKRSNDVLGRLTRPSVVIDTSPRPLRP